MNAKIGTLISLATGLAVHASTVVVDDFGGPEQVVTLTSLAPPEIAVGTFAYGGALGGVRDVAVWSVSVGDFAAGAAFGSGGYASFAGRGAGGIVWDGVAGLADTDGSNTITPDELDFGLNLDLSDCATGRLEISAFTDLTMAVLRIAVGSSAGDFARYDIPLTGPVGQFNEYVVDLGSPSAVVGVLDWSDVGAVALFVDGTAFANLDVLVERLVFACGDGGATVGMLGAGLVALGVIGRRVRR